DLDIVDMCGCSDGGAYPGPNPPLPGTCDEPADEPLADKPDPHQCSMPSAAGGGDPATKGGSNCPTGCGPSGEDVTDPVTLSTGEFWHSETDLHLKGRGFDFRLERTYRSLNIGHLDNSKSVAPLPENLRSRLGTGWD